MLLKKDRTIISNCAKKYNVGKVILFGSSLNKKKSNDIDIGVKNIKPEAFFKFYGELMFSVSKPLDIINLDKKNSFNSLIERDGITIYG